MGRAVLMEGAAFVVLSPDDPGLGIFHTDRRDRNSLALDVMEAARPLVDTYLLALLTQRTLAPSDFAETRRGACRLTPKLATELAHTTDTWRREVAPYVERVAHILLADTGAGEFPSPLTHSAHGAAWDARNPERRRHQPRNLAPALPASCRDCGAALPNQRRRYCKACQDRRLAERTVAVWQCLSGPGCWGSCDGVLAPDAGSRGAGRVAWGLGGLGPQPTPVQELMAFQLSGFLTPRVGFARLWARGAPGYGDLVLAMRGVLISVGPLRSRRCVRRKIGQLDAHADGVFSPTPALEINGELAS